MTRNEEFIATIVRIDSNSHRSCISTFIIAANCEVITSVPCVDTAGHNLGPSINQILHSSCTGSMTCSDYDRKLLDTILDNCIALKHDAPERNHSDGLVVRRAACFGAEAEIVELQGDSETHSQIITVSTVTEPLSAHPRVPFQNLRRDKYIEYA